MKKRLDVMDPNVQKAIDSKYTKRKVDVVIDINKSAEKMISVIDYYRTHPLEEIFEEIKKQVKKHFDDMDDSTSLKNATILAFKDKGRINVPEETINNVLNKITPDAAHIIIKNYKNRAYNEQLKKELEQAKSNYEIFSKITEADEIRFASLYQDMALAGELYTAKKESIEETAKEFDLDLPLCLSNTEAIDCESHKIISIEDANEDEKEFGSKIRDKFVKFRDYIEENEKPLALSFGISFISGACVFLSNINQSLDSPALLNATLTSGAIMAGLLIVYNSDKIKSFFKDKRTIEEAKKLGLLGLLVNWGTATNAFNKFEVEIEEKDNKRIEGGSNGLH